MTGKHPRGAVIEHSTTASKTFLVFVGENFGVQLQAGLRFGPVVLASAPLA